MDITKSTRHQAIVGLFGEYLIANWLSRSGFEVTRVDHTGIDLLAFSPRTGRLGITVKSRTRNVGAETTSVTIFRSNRSDRQKVLAACDAFACQPWIAVYVETADYADLFLTSLENFDRRYATRPEGGGENWRMGSRHVASYRVDQGLYHIRIDFSATNWWTLAPAVTAEARVEE